jgi:hypothetical protein
MYHELGKREEPLYLAISDEAQSVLDRACEFVTEHWKRRGVRGELHSSLRRAAVRANRIAGIMRLLRYHEKGRGLHAPKSVEVGIRDLEVGLRLAFTYLTHALQIAEKFGVKDKRENLNRDQTRFLETLPNEQFETSEAKEVAEDVGVPDRTFRRWLTRWDENTELIEKVSRGVWQKIQPGRDSEEVPGVLGVTSVLDTIFGDDHGSVGEIPAGKDEVPEDEDDGGDHQ